MTLTPGTKLGPYEIVAPLGAGGMGEVFRARDTRLGREVAIKALPPEFASDPERLARFEREARLLASLSHPNLAGIHGLEVVDGARYLVLEFVEGDTLAARLARGPLPLDECIEACRQIAAGVEAAHEAGVVHRDLKPGNVMLRSDGTVKVLDFGLAKGNAAHAASGSDFTISASPTMSYAPTNAGVILGTAAYMSPEQARGRAVDRRTDVWSFGCVLYECLTGRQVYHGETISDMVARILEREPEWAALPASTPPRLRELLRRCLTKDLKQRLQSIGEARIALEQPMTAETSAAAGAAPAKRSRVPSWAPWAATGALALTTLALLFAPGLRHTRSGEQRIELGAPEGQRIDTTDWPPVISPDGEKIVMAAQDSSGVSHLWLRTLDDFDFHLLKGTEGAGMPFWAPDSRALAYVAKSAIYRLALEDGGIQKVVDGVNARRGASWGRNGDILYTPGANADIWRVASSGGAPVRVTRRDTTLIDSSHRFPLWLPDGKRFLFAVWSNNPRVRTENCGIYVASASGGTPKKVSSDLGAFSLLRTGHLLVARNGGLVALPFNARTYAVGAQALTIADRVRFDPSSGIVAASASAQGDIALLVTKERPLTDMVWIDRAGHRGEPLGLRTEFFDIELSPDGSHVAGEMGDANGLSQVWTADLTRRTASRLTHGQDDSGNPVWSPDGSRVAFFNLDRGTQDLYVQLAAGTRPAERVWAPQDVDEVPVDWSADGRYLLCSAQKRTGSREGQIWLYDTTSRAARVLLSEDFNLFAPHLSPDGRWLAYVSDESGQPEVYVRSFPDLVGKWQVSTSGGSSPHWRGDGRELAFYNGSGATAAIWAVSIAPAGDKLSIGEPQKLFAVPSDVRDLECASDHLRFLALIAPPSSAKPALRLIQHWKPEEKR